MRLSCLGSADLVHSADCKGTYTWIRGDRRVGTISPLSNVACSNDLQFHGEAAAPAFDYICADNISHPIPATLEWYAVFTMANHEKRVSEHCQQREIEFFLPLYKVSRKWKNRCTVNLELPLFPCYCFVRISPGCRVKVLSVPGVVSIVSSGCNPLPVPDDDIRSLREGLLIHKVEPHANVAIGDFVRITTGPFAGAQGVLQRHTKSLRVVLRLELLARSVSVEVGAEEIELAKGSISGSGTSATKFNLLAAGPRF